MKTLSEIKGLLKGRNLAQVGRAVGLSRAYILRIKQGRAANPSYETVRKLSEYFEPSCFGRGDALNPASVSENCCHDCPERVACVVATEIPRDR
jgi:transcriptional regulator with XRE-family HTH domain